MLRVKSYVPNDEVASADLNAIQDNALGIAQPLGMLHWSGTFSAFGDAASPSVVVAGIGSMVLSDGTTAYVKSQEAPATIGISSLEGGGGSLAASTWYYLYAYISAGALAWQISTDPPTESANPTKLRQWKRATTPGEYRYLGCFRTDVNGNVLVVSRGAGGVYLYDADNFDADRVAEIRVLSTSSPSTSFAAVDCRKAVPPHCDNAALYAWLGDMSNPSTFTTRRTGSSASFFTRDIININVGEGRPGDWTQKLDGVQSMDYKTTSATSVINVYVIGFNE